MSSLSLDDLTSLNSVEGLGFDNLMTILESHRDSKESKESKEDSRILDIIVKDNKKVREYIKLKSALQNKIRELFVDDKELQHRVSNLLKCYRKTSRDFSFNNLKKIYQNLESPKDVNLKLILDSIDKYDETILEKLVAYNDIEFFQNYKGGVKINKRMLDVLESLDAKEENQLDPADFAAVRNLSHSLIYKHIDLKQSDFTGVKKLINSLRREPYSQLSASSQEEIYSLYIQQVNECKDSNELTSLGEKFEKFKKFIIPPKSQENPDPSNPILAKEEPDEGALALPNTTNMENDITLHSSLFMGDRKINNETLDVDFLNTIVDKINNKAAENLQYKIFHVICKLIVNELYDKNQLDDFIDRAVANEALFNKCYASPPYPSMEKFTGIDDKKYETFEKDPYGESHRENEEDSTDAKLSNGFYVDHPNAQTLDEDDRTSLDSAIQQADDKNVQQLQKLLKTGSYFDKVASAARLLYISKGYRLNTTQYVAVYNSLKYNNTYTKIATGEGKSRINMLLNAILSISPEEQQEDEHVQVNQQSQGVFITSNANLAKRDFIDYQVFFEICGVSSILLTENSNCNLDEFSKAQLIFTDESSWGLFLSAMYAKYPKSEVDGVLRAKNLIVDEADTLFYQSNPYNISQQTESLKSIVKLYEPIYKFIDSDDLDEKDLLNNFKRLNAELLSSCDVSDQKLLGLINAAKAAKQLEFGKHFAIDDDGRSARVVVVTDGQRAGLDSTYTGGVHQFLIKRLQLKKRALDNVDGKQSDQSQESLDSCLRNLEGEIEFTPESLVRYSLKGHELLQTAKSIKAVTGSLGNKSLLYGLKNFYSQDQLHVAKLKPHRISQRITPLSVPLFQNQQALIEKIQEKLDDDYKDRPVLIVTENDDEVCKYIHSMIQGSVSIDSETKNYDEIVSQAGGSGKVTVAVAGRAGRGTDIRVDSSVDDGLAVILTFVPTDREYKQIIGRCARQGQKGSVDILLYDETYQPNTEIKIEDFEEKTQVKSSSNSRSLWINNIKDRYINENFRQQFQIYLDNHRDEESSLQTAYANFREKVETEWLTDFDEIVKNCYTFDAELTNVNIALNVFKQKVIQYWSEFNQETSANIVNGDDGLEVPDWAKVILIQENPYIAALIRTESDLSQVDLKDIASKARRLKVSKLGVEANQEVVDLDKDNDVGELIKDLEKIDKNITTALENLTKQANSNDSGSGDDSDLKDDLTSEKQAMIAKLNENKTKVTTAIKTARALKNYESSHNEDSQEIKDQCDNIVELKSLMVANQPDLLNNRLTTKYNYLLNRYKKSFKKKQSTHLQKEKRDLFLLVGCTTLFIASLLIINILIIEFALILSLVIAVVFGIFIKVISNDFDLQSGVINKNVKFNNKVTKVNNLSTIRQKYVVFTRHGQCSRKQKWYGFKANTPLEKSCENQIQNKGNEVLTKIKTKVRKNDIKIGDFDIYHSPMERAKQTHDLLFGDNDLKNNSSYCLTESSAGLSGYNIRTSSDVLRYMVENIWLSLGFIVLSAVPLALSFVTVYWPIALPLAIPMLLIVCDLLYYARGTENGVQFSNESQKHKEIEGLITKSDKDYIWFVGHGKNFKNFIHETLNQNIESFDYCDSVVIRLDLDDNNEILAANVEGRIKINQQTGVVSADNDNEEVVTPVGSSQLTGVPSQSVPEGTSKSVPEVPSQSVPEVLSQQ